MPRLCGPRRGVRRAEGVHRPRTFDALRRWRATPGVRSFVCWPGAAAEAYLRRLNDLREEAGGYILENMPIPLSQMGTVAGYVLKQKLKGRKRYPLVLMLEPLYRCNLACAGCGKIQYPGHILKQNLTPEQCFKAVEETGVPTVAIPGGEPLMHRRSTRSSRAWWRARSTSICAPTRCFCARSCTSSSPAST